MSFYNLQNTPPFLSDLTKRYAKQLATAKRHRLVLLLFLAIAESYVLYLRHLENQMDAIQRKVQFSLKNKELLELLRYQKSLVYFLTSLESNDLILDGDCGGNAGWCLSG